MPSSVPHPEGLTPRSSSSYPCRSPQLDPPSVLDHRHHRPLPAAIFCCSPLEHTRRGTRAPSVSSGVASGNEIRRRHRRGIPQRLVPGGALTLHDLAGGVRSRYTARISPQARGARGITPVRAHYRVPCPAAGTTFLDPHDRVRKQRRRSGWRIICCRLRTLLSRGRPWSRLHTIVWRRCGRLSKGSEEGWTTRGWRSETTTLWPYSRRPTT